MEDALVRIAAHIDASKPETAPVGPGLSGHKYSRGVISITRDHDAKRWTVSVSTGMGMNQTMVSHRQLGDALKRVALNLPEHDDG